ncbi:MAG: acyl-CoA dehydrogenase [Polyangiaceae bacterium]|nr:acyl-CoA dehydrogenase [Polyangiaceae bacterium]
MTKPIQAINRYKADLREFNFLLFEQFKLGEMLGQKPYDGWGEEEIRSSLTECYRFVREVLGPLNVVGDTTGCKLENGKVITPKGFKEAWKKLYEAGWKSIAVPQEFGGAGSPRSLQVLVEELISGANTAFSMYAGLAYGAAEVIEQLGSAEQKKEWAIKMFAGQWGGTMCLTEANAGTDVGASKTTASRNPDGSYTIRGTKIFISGGDHDLAENIIHMVLARVDGAPAGTKGLTLFIVPKIRVNADGSLGKPNDVSVGALEHKMGINGSATCVLNFGDNGQCIGWPLGGEANLNKGMSQMFRLMNAARISVGVQGISVAASAYLNALEYSKERKQGANMMQWKDASAPRVPIIDHADVRRMLLQMKAVTEGLRALAIKLTHHVDQAYILQAKGESYAYHEGQVELLVPLIKAYASDQGFRVCETAIQTYGGAGYTRDYPVEQYCRDSKIFSIYEGTNHIQAMDLVGRKLGQGGGANFQAFLGDIATFVAANGDNPTLGAAVKKLGAAQEAVGGTAMRLLMWFQSGQIPLVPLAANRFLEMMSELTVAWLLLDGALVAEAAQKKVSANHPDHAFYAGKIQSALYYARNYLPGVEYKAQILADEDKSPLDIPEAAFATV